MSAPEEMERCCLLYNSYEHLLRDDCDCEGWEDAARRIYNAFLALDANALFAAMLDYFTHPRRYTAPTYKEFVQFVATAMAAVLPSALFDAMRDGATQPPLVRSAAEFTAERLAASRRPQNFWFSGTP